MSTSGLSQTYQPNTLDGLNVLDADQLYLDGQLVNLSDYVPYTGATQTVNLGGQNIKTTHAPVDGADLVNLTTLQNAVTFIDTSVANSFLNKIVTTDQTVAGKVTYNKELVVADEKPANLASKVVVGPTYPNITISSASVFVSQNFGTITNSSGVYQSTTNVSGGQPILIAFPITANKTYRFTMEVLVEDPTYTWYVGFLQSTDNINPVTGGVLPFTLLPANTSTFQAVDVSFTAVTTGNIIITVESDEPPPPTTNQAFKWKNLRVYEQGVALSNITTPSLTPDRVAVIDENNRLVSSGINVTKLGYLDNVSSDIQTQLNGKLANTNGQAFGTFDFTSTVPILFSGFNGSRALVTNASKQLAESSVTNTELGYVSGVTSGIQGQLNGKLSLTGGTLTGALTVNGNITLGNRLLGTPDNTPSGNFWMGLNGSGTEVQRLALAFTGNMTTGEVTDVLIAKPLSMGANKVTSTYVPANSEDLTNKTYVDGAISSAGALYVLKSGDTMTGNLGIGTSPDSTLHLYDTSTPLITMSINTVDYSYISAYTDLFFGANVKVGGTGIKNGNRGTASIKLVPEAYDGGYMIFSTSDVEGDAPTERMRIDKDGHVGIGTATPSAPLHITASGGGNPSSNGIYVLNPTNSASQDAIVSIRVAGSSGGDAFTSYDIAGEAGWATGVRNTDNAYVINQGWDNIRNQERFVINSSGNVGIGRSPSYKLDVSGDTRTSGSFILNNIGDCRFYNGSADAYNPTSTANNLIIKSWWGIGYESYDGGVRIAMDTRSGNGYYGGTLTMNNIYQSSNPLTSQSPYNNTSARLMFRETDGYVRHGDCSTWTYRNNSVAWTGSLIMNNALYRVSALSTIIFTIQASWWATSVGNKDFIIELWSGIVQPFVGTLRVYTSVRKYFNITANHETITIPITYTASELGATTGWYSFYIYAGGGGITSDSNDTVWWSAQILG
jgi:hypothetical protein